MKEARLNCNYINDAIYGYWSDEDKIIHLPSNGQTMDSIGLFMTVHFPKHELKMVTCEGMTGTVHMVYSDDQSNNPLEAVITQSGLCMDQQDRKYTSYLYIKPFQVKATTAFGITKDMQDKPAVKEFLEAEENRYGKLTEDFVWPIEIQEDFQPNIKPIDKTVLTSPYNKDKIVFVDVQGQMCVESMQVKVEEKVTVQQQPVSLFQRIKQFFG